MLDDSPKPPPKQAVRLRPRDAETKALGHMIFVDFFWRKGFWVYFSWFLKATSFIWDDEL